MSQFTGEELAALARQSRTGKLGRYFVATRPREGGVRLLYSAQERQDAAHAAAAPNIMYGGQAGGGKSHWARWHGIINCLRRPGLRVLLLRREFKDLETTHLLEIPKELPIAGEDAIASYNDGKHRLTFPHPGAHPSVIQFGHCRTLKELASYLSTQWDIIIVDEGSWFLPQMLRMLRTRLRTTLDGIRPQFIVATNPGGDGHLWLKQRFLTQNPPADEERNFRKEEWVFIPSALEDNAYLDAAEYDKQFSGLSDAEYRAYRRGDWDAFAGQYFTEWSRVHHVVPAGKFTLEDWYEVAAGMDWGYAPSPGWVGWAAFDQYGRATCYKELVFKQSSGPEVARMIWDKCTTPAERRMIIQGDTQMWTPQAAIGGVSIAEEINGELARLAEEAGWPESPVLVKANKDRMNGWHRVHQFLKPVRPQPEGDVGPWIRLVEDDETQGFGCPYLIDTLPVQVHDDNQTGDMKKGATDHACDGLRYLLIAREPIAEVPQELRPIPKHKQPGRAGHRRLVMKALAQQRIDEATSEAQADAIQGALRLGSAPPEVWAALAGLAGQDADDDPEVDPNLADLYN